MIKRRIYLLFICLFSAVFLCSAKVVKTEFSKSEQVKAVRRLISRVTDGRENSFKVKISEEQKEGRDWFSLSSAGGKIVLEGNNGVSIASALNYYLKEYCSWHYSWCGKNLELPEILPMPEGEVTKTSPYRYRYYLNYCTFNYSMCWWDEKRWIQEIDWMALNGINMPLAVTGQNSVWQRVYRKLGFSEDELRDFFSGPAYFSWFWMGNLDGWGGPLPQSFMEKHEALQKAILYAERSLGMTPVLPAFTGHVPPVLSVKYPDAKVRETSWVNFPEVSILDPGDELFSTIGQMFIKEQTGLYGTNHFYTADTFNENVPPTTDSLYLNDISAKVYNSMAAVDPEAVWVMQGWMFHFDRKYWGQKEIRALLGGVEDENMLILDLWSERYPVWNRTNSYYGKPWIWCMLQNFGQKTNLSGNLKNITQEPNKALHNPESGKMSGIGLTPEGIGHTPIVYAMFLENVWQDAPVDIDEFLHGWIRNRYGKDDKNSFKAWKLMSETVFENKVNSGGNESIISARPTFVTNPRGCVNTALPYKHETLDAAWDLLMASADSLSGFDGFRYDLVDVSRQALANYASDYQKAVEMSYKAGDVEGFDKGSADFIELIDDLDKLVATREEFLLGKWLEDAKAMGNTLDEKNLYERNARNLLTLWGNKDCSLSDYACRQWSGLLSGYYKPRWEMFFADVREAIVEKREFSQEKFVEKVKQWEWDWIHSTEQYDSSPVGNEVEMCRYIYEKYRNNPVSHKN